MEYNIGVGRGTDLEASVQEATAKFRNPKLILFFSEVAKNKFCTTIE